MADVFFGKDEKVGSTLQRGEVGPHRHQVTRIFSFYFLSFFVFGWRGTFISTPKKEKLLDLLAGLVTRRPLLGRRTC